MEAIVSPQLLLIAGTGRNTGKTTLACHIIRKFSAVWPIIAIKITPHFHEESQSGKILINKTNLFISEEANPATDKDSSRMLAAGAQMVYFVITGDEHLVEAYNEILKMLPKNALIICESGGLRHKLVPGLFFMMTGKESEITKPATQKLMLLADRQIIFDGEKINFDIDTIEIVNNQWTFKKPQNDII
ncbi:MAG: hypothetical protein WCL21_09815 [Mariniphaga sp.]